MDAKWWRIQWDDGGDDNYVYGDEETMMEVVIRNTYYDIQTNIESGIPGYNPVFYIQGIKAIWLSMPKNPSFKDQMVHIDLQPHLDSRAVDQQMVIK